ncbi:MAG: hypothetical protein KJ936_06950 [Proteobacteria bacterium]|nr:hypothetical protein [Pseudomonadota bacterium]MBU2227391.1 hypothetical protein [Pseudomonadota bacterium]MBU2260999.1 hypothetical protein [Pseudomonadota bacterium]
MSNLISGVIAISMLTVFLLYYAVKLHSVALWIIIVANVAFIIFDFVQSVREGGNNNGK